MFLVPGVLLAVQYYQKVSGLLSMHDWMVGSSSQIIYVFGKPVIPFPNFNWLEVWYRGALLVAMVIFLVWIALRSLSRGKANRLTAALWFLPGVVIYAYNSNAWESLGLALGLRLLCYVLFAGADAPKAVPAAVPVQPAMAHGTEPVSPTPAAPAAPEPDVPAQAPAAPVTLYATPETEAAAFSPAPASAPKAPAPTPEHPISVPTPPAEAPRFCAQCGKPLTTDAPFCPYCGSRVQ